MADLALKSGVTSIHVLNAEEAIQEQRVAAVALTSGDICYIVASGATAGQINKADADAIGTAKADGIVKHTVAAGNPVTVNTHHVLVEGFDLDDLDYGDDVYLSGTAGKIATTDVATISGLRVGRVVPAPYNLLGAAPAKVLELDFAGLRAIASLVNALEGDYI